MYSHNGSHNGLALAEVAAGIAGVSQKKVVAKFRKAGLLSNRGKLKNYWLGNSALNANGVPFQVVFGYGVRVVRLILDPFFDDRNDERTLKTLALLKREATDLGQSHLVDMLDIESVSQSAPQMGVLWIAYDLNRPMLTVYLNTELFADKPWEQIEQRLSCFLPNESGRSNELSVFKPHMKPVSLAMEINGEGDIKAKLYMRPISNDLSGFSAYLKTGINHSDFINLVAPSRPWPASGLTFSIAFDSCTGRPDGAKLDLCLCSSCRKRAAVSGIDRRIENYFPAISALSGLGKLALVGLGKGGKGSRTNLYYEPNIIV